MENEKPNIFYKYHNVNIHLYELIKENSFWISPPEVLNDNLEFKYTLTDNFYNRIRNESFVSVLDDLKRMNSEFEKINKEKFVHAMDLSTQNEKWTNSIYNLLYKINPLGVCCFTTNPHDELMWAHYASGSRGVCLKFDFNYMPELHNIIKPIEYDNELKPVNSADEIIYTFFRKRLVFKYEKEWRVVGLKKCKKPFNKQSLCEVIFGFNTSKEDKIKIIDTLLGNGYNHVKYRQQKINLNGINLSPLEEDLIM